MDCFGLQMRDNFDFGEICMKKVRSESESECDGKLSVNLSVAIV